MRIRKNAKLSPLLFSEGGSLPVESFQSHDCQLNQSPWDVIPFGPDSNQLEGEDSFTGNVSLGDSIGAVESVASMMDIEEKDFPKIENMVVEDKHKVLVGDNGDRSEEQIHGIAIASSDDDKRDKNLKIDGNGSNNNHSNRHSSNYHHSPSCSTSTSKKAAAAAAAAAAGARRARVRAGKKASSSSNPYEFYYYSGFGPLWGKRRGDRSGVSDTKCIENDVAAPTTTGMTTSANVVTTSTTQSSNSSTSSSEMDNEDQFDYVDDDEEDDRSAGKKKRMRKPVKARSLKSLM
ncbi:putative Membrane lipoprotein [Quillaja saponaria]|uniref:Membrane lipoprotein n=1 Tax=Quillaja saponaria TaxID=32244 RepID=A0AAD7PP59_QUISA|nr:putative Membrane lipoprotein [Quillaja saponaria]